MSNWEKLKRSACETGQTILMLCLKTKFLSENRTNNFNAWMELCLMTMKIMNHFKIYIDHNHRPPPRLSANDHNFGEITILTHKIIAFSSMFTYHVFCSVNFFKIMKSTNKLSICSLINCFDHGESIKRLW